MAKFWAKIRELLKPKTHAEKIVENALPVILAVVLDMSGVSWTEKQKEIQRQMRTLLQNEGVTLTDDVLNALINKYVSGKL